MESTCLAFGWIDKLHSTGAQGARQERGKLYIYRAVRRSGGGPAHLLNRHGAGAASSSRYSLVMHTKGRTTFFFFLSASADNIWPTRDDRRCVTWSPRRRPDRRGGVTIPRIHRTYRETVRRSRPASADVVFTTIVPPASRRFEEDSTIPASEACG